MDNFVVVIYACNNNEHLVYKNGFLYKKQVYRKHDAEIRQNLRNI